MRSAGRGGPHGAGLEMPCEACGVQFSVFRRKRACSECGRLYCAGCLRRGGGMCAPCRALSTRPLQRAAIAHLKPRDLQCFLHRQNVSTRGCVEKEDLLSLCVCHVNSAAYRRRGSAGGGAGLGGSNASFTLKGLTTNINDFLNSTFNVNVAPPPTTHAHTQAPRPPPRAPPPPTSQPRERFTTNPGGERDFRVMPPAAAEDEAELHRSVSGPRVDTADCFEVEDLDDNGWEFVARPPADPLPNDSEILMSEWSSSGGALPPPAALCTPQRAASVLELHVPPTTDPSDQAHAAERTSLQDEPQGDQQSGTNPLESTESAEAGETLVLELETLTAAGLEALTVRQLKALLARNRVEFRSCLERGELLARARALLHDHQARHAQLDALPLEECCKICMAAPLECVLLECGHIAACTACSVQLHECPICRRYVVRAVRCFRS